MVAAVFAFILLASGNGDDNPSSETLKVLREADCRYRHPKGQGRDHVDALPANFKPNSVPRSSGPHSSQTIIYGTYDQAVPDLNVVHNLEHGVVIINYGPQVPANTVEEIVDFYRDDPNGLIVAPHPRLGDDIALTAWTHVARCPAFDENVANAFIDEFAVKGPESCKNDIEQGCFRKENMEPGKP
jgi:hypothetical protein